MEAAKKEPGVAGFKLDSLRTSSPPLMGMARLRLRKRRVALAIQPG